MSRNTMTIVKWLPLETDHIKQLFADCVLLKKHAQELCDKMGYLLTEFKTNNLSTVRKNTVDSEIILTNLHENLEMLEQVKDEFTSAFERLNERSTAILEFKFNLWRKVLSKKKLKISYFLQQLIADIAYLYVYYGEKILVITFKTSNIFNVLLSLDTKYNLTNTMALSSNTCAYLLYPLRKISITKLLQIMAQNRAELCAHKLIDCLLESYRMFEHQEDDSLSDNSSMEIFRALTHHLSPPVPEEKHSKRTKLQVGESDSFLNLDKIIEYEEQNVLDLLNVALTVSPLMLGNDGIRKSKNGDPARLNSKAKEKVLNYYQEILWGEVGNYLEHIIVWWAPSPLAARPPHFSQHLREWIAQFTPTAKIPPYVISTLTSLADGLGVHVTSTSWDRHFRLALVASKSARNSETGQLFCDMLQDLVSLCNQCEVTNDWIVGAPLDELPLVEQIPVLHRLDHSVHTTILWTVNETKKLANNWNVHAFFMITHCDIVNCLSQLSNVRFVDHTLEIEKGGLDVHVEVCSKMRAKLISEVKVNIQKLKETTKECVDCLASVCTTISLANLQMIFPRPNYWCKNSSKPPEKQSTYVYKYLEQLLTPVILATEDHLICNMILKLMCEAWLDHIYCTKIKFSEAGAVQLLADFASVATWIIEHDKLNDLVREKLLRNEVLRRCEGVGRLLLRNPGEKIKMNDKYKKIVDPDRSPARSEATQLMPAEMYVPNQEQWLELRANKGKMNFTLYPLCCGDT